MPRGNWAFKAKCIAQMPDESFAIDEVYDMTGKPTGQGSWTFQAPSVTDKWFPGQNFCDYFEKVG